MDDTNANETKDQPVTISAPPAAAVIVDPQNPLPEPSFAWRRILTFLVSAALLGIAWHNAIQLHDLGVSDHLLEFAKWCIALNGFVLLCYFVGPSAAEITNIIQSANILKKSLSVAETAAKQPENRPETPREARFGPSGSVDSHIPLDVPDAAPGGNEADAAPRGRI
jgi:hypothetical protein